MPSLKRLRRRNVRTGKRLHPAAIVGICLASAILVTLIIGNLLKIWLDDETYSQLTSGIESPQTNVQTPPVGAPAITAPLFEMSDRVSSAQGNIAVSVPINRADGTMCYTSNVTDYFDLPSAQNAPGLASKMQSLYATVPYISGVFYSDALEQPQGDLRYAATVRDAAVLREFYHAGASELVIRGLPLETCSEFEVAEYINAIRINAQNFRVGVAVPIALAESESGWRILASLWGCADFLVLDVSAAVLDNDVDENGNSASINELLGRSNYYLSQYGMRLMASKGQSLLVEAIENKPYSNYQIAAD